MANHKQAMKRYRQSLVRRDRNRARRSSMKTAVKKALDAITEAAENRTEVVRAAISEVARAGQKGLIHWKTAARKVGKLSKKLSAVN